MLQEHLKIIIDKGSDINTINLSEIVLIIRLCTEYSKKLICININWKQFKKIKSILKTWKSKLDVGLLRWRIYGWGNALGHCKPKYSKLEYLACSKNKFMQEMN